MRVKNEDFFLPLVRGMDYACEAAKLLDTAMADSRLGAAQARMSELSRLLSVAESERQRQYKRLTEAFITPIERDDLWRLARRIGDVSTNIGEAMAWMRIVEQPSFPMPVRTLAGSILPSCMPARRAVGELHRLHSSDAVQISAAQLVALCARSREAYIAAMRHVKNQPPDGAGRLYNMRVCDSLFEVVRSVRRVGTELETVVLKNI